MPQTLNIFLDLDGVLWPDSGAGAILDAKNLAIGVKNLEFLSKYFQKPNIYIVTNQTLAARGQIDYEVFQNSVDESLNFLINQGLLTDYRVCYHHPNALNAKLRQICFCRKPSPGMILDLIIKYNINALLSIFIGDRITDVVSAQLAGITRNYLIYNSKMLEFNDNAFNPPKSIHFSVINKFEDIEVELK